MFTGIISEVGTLRDKVPVGPAMRMHIRAPSIAASLSLGDSVACNGVCLTAEEISADGFFATAVPETLRRSTLGAIRRGDAINLESALKAGAPMGGHIVQGHVDGIGTVSAWRDLPAGAGMELTIRIPRAQTRYCVEKGSLCLHGVSLTIASIAEDVIRIALVPHTLAHTNLGGMKPGDVVNFEVDIIGKYVEKLLGFLPKDAPAAGLTGASAGLFDASPGASAVSGLDAASLGKWGYGV